MNNKKYMVIEIEERDVITSTIKLFNNYTDALIYANDLLKKHAVVIGCEEEFRDGEECAIVNPGGYNAWANFGGINWDAHIIEIDS